MMANRQGHNSLVTDLFQQLHLDQNRQTYALQQHSSMLPNLNRNPIAQSHQSFKEITTPKRTRRKRRQRKNEKTQEDDISRHSVSSNSSASVSSLKGTLVFESTSNSKLNENYYEYSSPSSSANNPATPRCIQSLKDVMHFSIKPVHNNENSIFLRKRNTTQRFINLRSFLKTASCIFISKYRPSSNHKNIEKSPKQKSRWEKRQKERQNETFDEYISEEQVKEGLTNNTLVRGFIRINPKNSRESYINNEDSSIADYFITSIADRNRALEGDEVILKIKPEEEWTAGNKTAKVVYIVRKVHTRKCVGTLKPAQQTKSDFALFVPRDKRFPTLRISEIFWPDRFREHQKEFENILFLGQLLEWKVPSHAQGILVEKLGQSGNLQIESISLLKENNLDFTPFSDELKAYIPELKKIAEKEFEYREDIRKKCVFTIDPATARDLDDAVSVEILPNGNYEVGVHISDASYFLEEGTELDQAVSKKATSIYLVNGVYHMLPDEMCMGCSLLPGEDKLSFSVFWEMNTQAEILNKRFTRTIMNSCAKLSYEHAQKIIEDPDVVFSTTDFPTIYNGFTQKDVINSVLILQSLAVILRNNRIEKGCLKISNIKMRFSLNPTTGEPMEFSIEENKEANRLIEEFMLLANITVARKIYDHFPEFAFLRCHDPPKDKMLNDLQNKLSMFGIHLNMSSSADIAASLKKYVTDDFAGQCREVALKHLTLKAMTRAQYFCAGKKNSEDDFKHYALSIPIYTHFTSPIRRYADIMVHRLLAASLNYRDPPEWDVDYVEAIANNCNVQKYQAKKAGDASIELYLAHYIEKHKPFTQDCVVVDVRESKFDAIVLSTGSIVRIYQNTCPKGTVWTYESNKLTITFPKMESLAKDTLSIELFSLVTVTLKRKDSYHLEGRLVIPKLAKRPRYRKKGNHPRD